MFLYTFIEPYVLVTQIFLLSKRELQCISNSSYNHILRDTDSRDLLVFKLFKPIREAYLGPQKKNDVDRKEEKAKYALGMGTTVNSS